MLNKPLQVSLAKFMNNFKLFFHYFLSDGCLKIGMFLPPCWHLLFKITSQNNSVIVSMATDNIKLLTLSSEYLHHLEEMEE